MADQIRGRRRAGCARPVAGAVSGGAGPKGGPPRRGPGGTPPAGGGLRPRAPPDPPRVCDGRLRAAVRGHDRGAGPQAGVPAAVQERVRAAGGSRRSATGGDAAGGAGGVRREGGEDGKDGKAMRELKSRLFTEVWGGPYRP